MGDGTRFEPGRALVAPWEFDSTLLPPNLRLCMTKAGDGGSKLLCVGFDSLQRCQNMGPCA